MIYNIQVLRALAAVLVMFVHLELLVRPLGLRHADLEFGNVGVDLFFVISGFVMVHTGLRRPVGAGAFLLNRVIRVVPLYWIMTLVVFAVALAAPFLLGSTRPAWGDLARSLAFVPFVKANGLVQPVLFVGWTLNYEMFFYLVFAAALLVSRRSMAATLMIVATALTLLVAWGAIAAPGGVAARFYTDPIVLEFALGMAIAWVLRGEGAASVVAGGWLLGAGLAVLLLGPFVLRDDMRLLTAGLPAAAVLAGAVMLERGGHALHDPRAQVLGGASYALYLVHPFPFQGLAKLAGAALSPVAAVLLIAFGFALAIAIALAVHVRVERPVTDRLRRLVHHRPPIVDRVEAAEARGGESA